MVIKTLDSDLDPDCYVAQKDEYGPESMNPDPKHCISADCGISIDERSPLKGLSHEIDFKDFDKKFAELGLTMGGGWFLSFLGAPMIL